MKTIAHPIQPVPATARPHNHSQFFGRIVSMFIVFILAIGILPSTALAANPVAYAAPNDLIGAVAKATGLEANADALVEAGYLTPADQRHLEKYGMFSYAVAWYVLLPTFGIYPYPAELYPEISPHPEWPNGTVYADARAAAILCDLASPDTQPNYPISAQDFQTLLRRLQTESFTIPVPNFSCPFITSVEADAAAAGTKPWNVHTYLGRNSLISAYPLIPETWIADFAATGYEIRFELPADRQSSSAKLEDYRTVGLTSYTDRFIAVAGTNPRITLHEFVHYIAKRTNLDSDHLRTCFNNEYTGVRSLIGLYAGVNPSEYLAEFTSYWLLNPTEHDTLRKLAPDTTLLAEYLILYFQPTATDELPTNTVNSPTDGSPTTASSELLAI